MKSSLVVAFLLILTTAAAHAGAEANLSDAIDAIDRVERQVQDLPASQAAAELTRQIEIARHELEQVRQLPPSPFGDRERRTSLLMNRLSDLQFQLNAANKAIANFRAEIGRGDQNRFFPLARNRIAVFTFDDPHGTSLGDSISFLLSKKILFSTSVPSLAIIDYREGTERRSTTQLAYFDQVDAVTKDQQFQFAIWGRLARTAEGIRIDTYLQVPVAENPHVYIRQVQLPRAMGGGQLTARLKPDRVLLQTLNIRDENASLLKEASNQVATLRAEPSTSAEVTGHIDPSGGPVEYSITSTRGDWIRIQFRNGQGGWTNINAFCRDVCQTGLDAATVAENLMRLKSGLPDRELPASLTMEARALTDQLRALIALNGKIEEAIWISSRWIKESRAASAPFISGFENLLAVAQIKEQLKQASSTNPDYDRIQLERPLIKIIAQELAEASVRDPSNLDIVENLAVLFAYLGDDRRHDLAVSIAEDLKSRRH